MLSLDGDPRHRGRDDLDDLIDDFLPEVESGAGWFDVGLLAVGAALLGWAVLGSAPAIAAVSGVIAVGLGCVLPLRSGWRRAKHRRWRRRREDLLGNGVPIEASSPSTLRLVLAYEELLALEPRDGHEIDDRGPLAAAAAHGALLEAATVLGGRSPEGEREAEYVEKRAVAIENLTRALRDSRPPGGSSSGGHPPSPLLEPGVLVEAREEVDEIAGYNSVSRLEELAEEARIRRHGHA